MGNAPLGASGGNGNTHTILVSTAAGVVVGAYLSYSYCHMKNKAAALPLPNQCPSEGQYTAQYTHPANLPL
jgi:hypothetical protein